MQIIHLKRFQFHNGRWVKSHKIVKFPFRDFDPTNYLVPGSSHHDNHNNNTETDDNYSSSYHNDDDDVVATTTMARVRHNANGHLASGMFCHLILFHFFIFWKNLFSALS